jgi:hypothetical protein
MSVTNGAPANNGAALAALREVRHHAEYLGDDPCVRYGRNLEAAANELALAIWPPQPAAAPFADYLLRQAGRFEALALLEPADADGHSWAAEHYVKLARWARFLEADSPEMYEARDRGLREMHAAEPCRCGRAQ